MSDILWKSSCRPCLMMFGYMKGSMMKVMYFPAGRGTWVRTASDDQIQYEKVFRRLDLIVDQFIHGVCWLCEKLCGFTLFHLTGTNKNSTRSLQEEPNRSCVICRCSAWSFYMFDADTGELKRLKLKYKQLHHRQRIRATYEIKSYRIKWVTSNKLVLNVGKIVSIIKVSRYQLKAELKLSELDYYSFYFGPFLQWKI